MANLIILSWNIKDLNEAQVNDPEFIALVVKVIEEEKADLVSILETKSDKGKDLCAKVTAKLGKHWASAYSGKSAPFSNKPENYVFFWNTKLVSQGSKAKFKFPDAQTPQIGFPNRHNNGAKKSPSRFPYLGEFKVANTTFTCVVFHTTFASVDIAEANQNLARIDEVCKDTNVIIMGDFNDDPAPGKSRTYRGKSSFQDLTTGLKFSYHISAKTSLCQAYLPSWTSTVDCRASVYDNFFIKTSGDFTSKKAEVVDLVHALKHGNYLSKHGKNLFNSWARRENKLKAKKKANWTLIPEFQPTDQIATLEDAHEVHWVAISDHLPIRLTLTVK
jgi:endonuclease/exonuclease/phosphatase family metal-dependent hydrolase